MTHCRVFYSQRAECTLLVCDVTEWIWREMKVERRIEEMGTGTLRKKDNGTLSTLLSLCCDVKREKESFS